MHRFAPAKVNFGLSVLGQRPDGYHDLCSVMVPLDVGDTLTLTPADTLTLRCEGPFGAGLPEDSGNLVFRAARAYLDAAGASGGVDIVLRKNLPLASGLGGGSSDAAAALLALHGLYPAPVDLAALALGLGADVPFFLGSGAALAQGVGERLSPVSLPPVHLVLANPGTAVSARDAYRWLDGGFTPPLRPDAIAAALERGAEVPYFNALQPGVLARHPEIGAVLDALAAAGLTSVLLSGSGASCFGLARGAAGAQAAARALQAAHPGWWVAAARTRA